MVYNQGGFSRCSSCILCPSPSSATMNLGSQNRMAKEKSMTATPTLPPQIASAELPAVPLTTEGYSVLHQMMRIRWSAWRALPAADRSAITQEAASVLGALGKNSAL